MKHKEVEKYKLKLKDLASESSNTYKKIECPSCKSEAPADNLNINDKIAKCSNCNVVFSFKAEVLELSKTKKIKQEIIRPEGIDMFYFQDDLDITIQRPLSPLEVLLGFFLPFFAAIFTLLYFTKPEKGAILPIITWLLSLWPLYNLSTHKKHKIHIAIDDKYLSLERRPKKFAKDQHFSIHDIDQLYIRNEHGLFCLYLVENSGQGQKHVKLIGGMQSISKVKYLEQEIEHHLGIENRPVPEEIK